MATHKLDMEKVKRLKDELANLPSANESLESISARAAVSLLADEIRNLREKGYTYSMISDALRSRGLDISSGTLSTYMARERHTGSENPLSRGKKALPRGLSRTSTASAKSTRPSPMQTDGGFESTPPLAPRTPGSFIPPPDKPDL